MSGRKVAGFVIVGKVFLSGLPDLSWDNKRGKKIPKLPQIIPNVH
jgi:hypothetical protein